LHSGLFYFALMNLIKRYWEQQPLTLLLVVGLFFRLVAAIFSKGWGMFDDHYLVIEASQSWVDDFDYNNWLPWNQDTDNPVPDGHSFFYVGLHYYFFSFLQNVLGIVDPQVKMYFVRIIHAFYSLLTISLSYKITKKLSNEHLAKHVGLLIALLWLFPILSVKNLVEMVCIPPLLGVAWNFIRYEEEKKNKFLLFAGLLIGIAIGIRYQAGFFAMGFGLYLLIRKYWAGATIFGLVGIGTFFLTQASDLFIWERPFAEFGEYIRYNIEHRVSYFDRPWYMYLGTVGGLLIPPVSLMLMAGFGYKWKKYLVLVLPSFLFFAFHSYFPNKQERFILPFIPFLIIVGIMGWDAIQKNFSFWQKRPKLISGSWKFFWGLNTIVLIFITPAYTKRSQVEAMYWLRNVGDYNNLIVDASHVDNPRNPPKFYLGSWKAHYWTTRKTTAEDVRNMVEQSSPDMRPNYVVFMEEEQVAERKARFEKGYDCELDLVATIDPSYIDALLHTLNPNNENFTTRIYKINEH